MIVDTSALIAVLRGEPDADHYADAVTSASRPRMSAATYVEGAAVVDANRDPVLSRRLDELLDATGIAVEPLTTAHAENSPPGVPGLRPVIPLARSIEYYESSL